MAAELCVELLCAAAVQTPGLSVKAGDWSVGTISRACVLVWVCFVLGDRSCTSTRSRVFVLFYLQPAVSSAAVSSELACLVP